MKRTLDWAAASAARLLLDVLCGAQPAGPVELATALVVRGSTAKPPRRSRTSVRRSLG